MDEKGQNSIKKGTQGRREFILRTAKDTVASFGLEGIKISLEVALEMTEKEVLRCEKEGELSFQPHQS